MLHRGKDGMAYAWLTTPAPQAAGTKCGGSSFLIRLGKKTVSFATVFQLNEEGMHHACFHVREDFVTRSQYDNPRIDQPDFQTISVQARIRQKLPWPDRPDARSFRREPSAAIPRRCRYRAATQTTSARLRRFSDFGLLSASNLLHHARCITRLLQPSSLRCRRKTSPRLR